MLNKVRASTLKKLDVVCCSSRHNSPHPAFGKKYALTLMCDLSKYLVTISITDKSTRTVARAIFEKFILQKIDQGTEFKNEILHERRLHELCTFLKIIINVVSIYQHQSVGTVECNHRVFNEYMKGFISKNIPYWDTHMKYFSFYHNTTQNTVYDNYYTTFESVFGITATMPNEMKANVDPVHNVGNYSREIRYRLQKTHANVIDKPKAIMIGFPNLWTSSSYYKTNFMIKIRISMKYFT